MRSSFNPQILADKLAKLNSSRASIETLSHWCIFHMNKAKHVVETWDRQFRCAPREQRLAYLFLANDILQNSRRKGSEFVVEFWKVLPGALHDLIEKGDEYGRNATFRLIKIWEERKVFGSQGLILKEELMQLQPKIDNMNSIVQAPITLQKQPIRFTLDKIVSDFDVLYGGETDEDAILSRCANAVSYLEKAEKEIEGDHKLGHSSGPAVLEEMQGQRSTLKNCIEQLRVVETTRSNLISRLREAIHEQELRQKQLHNQLQAAKLLSERVDNLCSKLLNQDDSHRSLEQNPKETPSPLTPHQKALEQTAAVMYAKQASFPENPNPNQTEEDRRKSAAAAMAAKLTASTSSAQMLSYVISSLASEGVPSNPQVKDSFLVENSPEKRPKLENSQPPPTPISLPETNGESVSSFPASLPSQPPISPFQLPQLLQPLQPLQPPGRIHQVPFNFTMPTLPVSMSMSGTEQQVSSFTGYLPSGAQDTPENSSYQNFQGSEGFYRKMSPSSSASASSTPVAPVSRQ